VRIRFAGRLVDDPVQLQLAGCRGLACEVWEMHSLLPHFWLTATLGALAFCAAFLAAQPDAFESDNLSSLLMLSTPIAYGRSQGERSYLLRQRKTVDGSLSSTRGVPMSSSACCTSSLDMPGCRCAASWR
jgi:hypothetical protein